MANYRVGSVMGYTNDIEILRCDESGWPLDRFWLQAPESAAGRQLDIDIRGETVVATDAFDPSYKFTYYIGDAADGDYIDPL